MSTASLPREIIRAYLDRIAWRRSTRLSQRGSFDEKYAETVMGAFLATGSQYFDKQVIVARMMELNSFQPFMTFSNSEGQFFFQKNPQKRYLIGADVATGRQVADDDTDYCCASVIELVTGEQVASYMARVTPEQFALDLADMGNYYGTAEIAVERTGDGGTVIVVLKNDCNYENLYRHKEWDQSSKKVVYVEGFPTTTKTRPIALNKLNWHLLRHPELFWDNRFLGQALTFVRNEKGKPEAQVGAHDDAVSANWIAQGARNVLLNYWDPIGSHREAYLNADRLTEDMAVEEDEVADRNNSVPF